MSFISARRYPRLPDQVKVNFGPPDLMARTFLTLDRFVRDHGIFLSISRDLDELVEINKSNLEAWYPLLPMFDPNYGGATPENTFWIRGVDQNGTVVLSQCARLFLWSDSTLESELETMGVFYAGPGEKAHVGEHCIVGTQALDAIRGRVCFTGGLWFRPDFRGRGLAHVMPRLTRAFALTTWRPDFFFSVLQEHIVAAGMPKVYGWRHLDAPVYWRGCPLYGDLDLAVGWMNTEETIDDLGSFAVRQVPVRQP